MALALAIAATPTALAAEEPRPDALWQAFPLEPAPERPASPLLPPAQGRSEATTVTQVATVADTPSEASRPSAIVLAFAALLLLLATVGVLSGRRLYVKRHRGASPPLWQGVAWPQSSDNVRELPAPSVRTSSALVGAEQRAGEPHPDVLAPRYRWANDAPARRSRLSFAAGIVTTIRRARRAVWSEDTAPAILGAGVAVVVGFLLVYLIG